LEGVEANSTAKRISLGNVTSKRTKEPANKKFHLIIVVPKEMNGINKREINCKLVDGPLRKASERKAVYILGTNLASRKENRRK
jgi:hypothetical protein